MFVLVKNTSGIEVVINNACSFVDLLCTSQWFSGVPTGFDSYLLPLGQEFDNDMSQRVGN
jgi:hypothetical protein